MFGLHMPELIIILVVALLIFGPKKLPEMGSAIGKSIREFRKGVNEISQPKEEEAEPVQKFSTPESIESQSASKKPFIEYQSNPSTVNNEVASNETRVD
jgi:sec-independent protein translocase protein TatA